MKRPPKILWILASLSGALAIVAFAWFGYFSGIVLSSRGTGSVVWNSALLPRGWQTYRADVWSVGYPSNFDVVVRQTDSAVSFRPMEEPEAKTYFLVKQESMSLDAYRIARDAEGYLAPTDVMISNYSAAKYVIGNAHTEYVVSYHDGVIIVSSDDIDDETIAIMFATFNIKTE